MKRNLLLIAMALCAQTGIRSAGDLQTVTSLDEVIEIAKKSKKPVVLKMFTTWCKFCPAMHENLQAIANDKKLGSKFIFLSGDAENFDGVEDLNVTGYPAVIVFKGGLTPKGELIELDRIFGDEEELRCQLNALK
jgi:thiol-disulfide isomerase/thioredoxin